MATTKTTFIDALESCLNAAKHSHSLGMRPAFWQGNDQWLGCAFTVRKWVGQEDAEGVRFLLTFVHQGTLRTAEGDLDVPTRLDAEQALGDWIIIGEEELNQEHKQLRGKKLERSFIPMQPVDPGGV